MMNQRIVQNFLFKYILKKKGLEYLMVIFSDWIRIEILFKSLAIY